MSTLNTFGFNVRRKRNHTPQNPLPSKQVVEKSTPSTGPILAFTAPTLPITKSKVNPPINKTTTKSKTNKQQLPKDPKQSTLLPFFTSTPSSSPTPLPITVTQTPSPTTLLRTTSPSPSPSSQDNTVEENHEICLVKRHVTMNEILPMLVDAFGDRIQQQQQQPTILLQVKPNKTIRTIQSTENNDMMMDFTIENNTTQSLRRSRSYQDDGDDDDDDETESLRTAFSKSLCLVPMKKRICGHGSNQQRRRQQQRMISGLFENENERHLNTLEDEFDDQQQEQDNEIHMVRQRLSPDQVNSLLLDIANEYLAFENHTWCASYIGGDDDL